MFKNPQTIAIATATIVALQIGMSSIAANRKLSKTSLTIPTLLTNAQILNEKVQSRLRMELPQSDSFKHLKKRNIAKFIGTDKECVELGLQIAAEMAATKYEFQFNGFQTLMRNIVYRMAIVAESRRFSQLKFGFPENHEDAFMVDDAAKHWKNVRLDNEAIWKGSRLLDPDNAALGLGEIIALPADQCVFNCNSALVLIYLRAELDIMPEKDFNAKYKGLVLGTGDLEARFRKYQPVQILAECPPNEFVTGDWVEFRTEDQVIPIWRAENALVIRGKSRTEYFAHLPWDGFKDKQSSPERKLTGIYSELEMQTVLGSLRHIMGKDVQNITPRFSSPLI